MKREWRNIEKNIHFHQASNELIHYYYQSNNGLIVGSVYNLAHTTIWCAKILRHQSLPLNTTQEKILGQYIELEFAKRAVEEYWQKEDRTVYQYDAIAPDTYAMPCGGPLAPGLR